METALYTIYNDLTINSANGKCTLFVQLELSAAFDSADVTLRLGDPQRLVMDGNV